MGEKMKPGLRKEVWGDLRALRGGDREHVEKRAGSSPPGPLHRWVPREVPQGPGSGGL